MKDKNPKYYLNSSGEFVIENYNFAKPLANFFPGIAGKYGIPMWTFYVNRGQAIASFGTKDKDRAILEFFPANKAWQLTSLQGFRTFIKISSGKKIIFYEPFHCQWVNSGFNLSHKMSISPSGLKIEESNFTLGLNIKVEYFNIPNDSFAALTRIVTIRNTGKSQRKIQLLDGLPQVVPYGTSNLFLKKLGRTIEAWMNVENLEKGVPFYKLDVDPTDRPEVIHIKEGNFYLGFHYTKGKPQVIRPIVNPEIIFGQMTDFCCPRQFLSLKNFIAPAPAEKITKNKTPCAFLPLNLELRPNEEKTFYCLSGFMHSREILNSTLPRIISADYFIKKGEENKKIIEGLGSDIYTDSADRRLDLYAKQTYIDNILRGGYPITFGSRPTQSVFYLYSRKHGDLERDYNKFQLQPTYFSQGNGNYRDMNQNRRNDVWFHPQIKDENVIDFFNLLQADGFNPLVIKGTSFTLRDEAGLRLKLKGLMDEVFVQRIIAYLNKPFTPGEAILFLEENKIKLRCSYDDFLNILISHSQKLQDAEHGEGFWTDHWTYNLDLLESYLGIYPEKLKEIVFEKRVFTFYDNTETVKARQEKYLLKDGKIRQLHSVIPDNAKREMIRKRKTQAHTVRAEYGKGEIYQTTLMNKLLCLLANKLASLDPFGVGVEMEADKPNWFDALNGLPSLLGSSICETFELKRLVNFISDTLEKTKIEKMSVTEEICDFLIKLDKLLRDSPLSGTVPLDFQYWDKSYSLKEEYRQKTRLGFSGKEWELDSDTLKAILNNALKKIDSGIQKAKDNKKNIYSSYFINEVRDYAPLKTPFVKPTRFFQKKLPLFLEGQVHALRLSEGLSAAKQLYKDTKSSQLFDKELKMYKVTAPLSEMPEEIGRCRVFSPGWLENESIWLHMEYKYLLELLRKGLYEEFYVDFKNALIPFQKAQRYGRSILENSSFIVSSAFADKKLHGNGFVARLSGSTAEFLNIWLIMNIGQRPFILNSKEELDLQFKPILQGWLFHKKNSTYSFRFLSAIQVVYHNPKRKDTFGKNPVKIKRIIFMDKDGRPAEILSDTIPAPFAAQIRSCQINKIDIWLE